MARFHLAWTSVGVAILFLVLFSIYLNFALHHHVTTFDELAGGSGFPHRSPRVIPFLPKQQQLHIEKEDKAMLRLDPADRCTLWSANMMREYGVRIMNAKKNVGKKKVSLVRCHSQPLWCFPPFVLVYLSALTINTNHTYTRNTSTMF